MNSLRLFLLVAFLTISLKGGLPSPIGPKSEMDKSTTEITAAFVDFKKRVGNQLPADYMNEKYFLYNYLKKHKFDVDFAYEHMQEYVNWWKEENIAGILDENWEDMRGMFPYRLDTSDPEGRPILYRKLFEWDIATYLIEGGLHAMMRFRRYFNMIFEEAEHLVRQRRAENYNITSYEYLINAEGFSLDKTTCVPCLLLHVERQLIFKFVPSNIENVIVFNVEPSASSMLSHLTEYMPNVTLLGEDRSSWINSFPGQIERNELPRSALDF